MQSADDIIDLLKSFAQLMAEFTANKYKGEWK